MRYIFIPFLIFSFLKSSSQSINLNESHINDYLRVSKLLGNLKSDFSKDSGFIP